MVFIRKIRIIWKLLHKLQAIRGRGVLPASWFRGPAGWHRVWSDGWIGRAEKLRAKAGRAHHVVDSHRHSTPPLICSVPLPRPQGEPGLQTAL